MPDDFTTMRRDGWHIFWLGAGFSRDFGLPLFSDFLKHTEILYSYEGLIPPIQRKTLDEKYITVHLADACRVAQPTDEEDKKALEITLNFRENCQLPAEDSFNLEKMFSKAVEAKDEEIKEAIMRVVVRTFDLALHYRFRDRSAWKRVYSSENSFWGNYPLLNPHQRKQIYRKFFNLVGRLQGNVAIITVNWDAAIFEAWTDFWAEKKEGFENKNGYKTFPLPGFPQMERVALSDAIECGFELPSCSSGRIFFIPLHGTVNLLSCPSCLMKNDAIFVGGQVHNYKYRRNYNEPGWSKKKPDDESTYQMICTRHCSPLSPVLSPPSEKQNVQNSPVLDSIWKTAAMILNDVNSIHFIGASFPASDIEIRIFLGEKLKKLRKCTPISITAPETYENYKKWNGYSLLKDFRCVETRSNLQHFISDPPFPFNG